MTSHAAPDAALGYLYQSELALLELVRRSKKEPALTLAIELFDDVSFERDGTPTELLQAKHRLRTRGSLSDASSDIWTTLRAWMDVLKGGHVQLETTHFSIATTGVASQGSAAAYLRPDVGRAPTKALSLLERTAQTSTSKNNAAAYQQFLDLPKTGRSEFVGSITVFDGSPTIIDISDALARELRFASEARFLSPLTERLLGWWHRRVIRHLLDPDDRIFAEEVDLEVDSLRDQFKSDNLPIDVALEDIPAGDLSQDDRIFVQQLRLIAANQPTIEIAIRDYKRAFLQRSRWVNDQLVTDSELHAYEERLIDEWEHQFSFLDDAEDGEAAALTEAGLSLYRDLQDSDLWIRARCQERFIARGSYHKLADELSVGWHPQFVTRLRTLLEPAEQ